MKLPIESIDNFSFLYHAIDELKFFRKKEYNGNLLILHSVETNVDYISFISDSEYETLKSIKSITRPFKDIYSLLGYNFKDMLRLGEDWERKLLFLNSGEHMYNKKHQSSDGNVWDINLRYIYFVQSI